ncbi:MAG: single-stranded DNA-binding protein [Candidatus Izemoplasmatales bacterium]|nr:single-stranded DNA-binding protein [Candidatus Izemoplasmatales bacterium]MDD4070031.1 single-stranded DNA-binding protein [Candidatus Izemoplasmatales bacterium]MDY0138334.1 single-stranded DNA-binding protein [Candidatus Izemoplasmatales bacterium]
MFNKVVLIGRLTRDPELRYTPNNIPVCTFSLAVNRPFQSNTNDKNADFFNCTAWRKQAENVAKYVNKGSMVAIEGRLQTRDYMDEKINARRYVTEIVCDSVVFLDTKSQGTENDYNDKTQDDDVDTGNFNNIEDDLPF